MNFRKHWDRLHSSHLVWMRKLLQLLHYCNHLLCPPDNRETRTMTNIVHYHEKLETHQKRWHFVTHKLSTQPLETIAKNNPTRVAILAWRTMRASSRSLCCFKSLSAQSGGFFLLSVHLNGGWTLPVTSAGYLLEEKRSNLMFLDCECGGSHHGFL